MQPNTDVSLLKQTIEYALVEALYEECDSLRDVLTEVVAGTALIDAIYGNQG